MFINQDEISYRKSIADEKIRSMIGEAIFYYHTVNKGSAAPDTTGFHDICASEVIVVGLRMDKDESPYEADLAVPVQVPGVFVLLEKVLVDTARISIDDESRVAFVEHAHHDMIIEVVNAWRDSLQAKPQKRNHLSLVVDNENTVEKVLGVEVDSKAEIDQYGLIVLLQDHISDDLMATARQKHFRHRAPIAIKADSDHDFLDKLLAQKLSGLFYRDALRQGEVYALIVIDEFRFVVGLRSLRTFYRQQTGVFCEMGDLKFKVDIDQLTAAVRAL